MEVWARGRGAIMGLKDLKKSSSYSENGAEMVHLECETGQIYTSYIYNHL